MKIITMCGSFKYKDEMMKIGEELQLQGNCVILPNFPTRDNYTEDEIFMLGQMYKEKIKISDTIFVVNIDNYIGSATKSEIELAQKINKEIIYFVEPK